MDLPSGIQQKDNPLCARPATLRIVMAMVISRIRRCAIWFILSSASVMVLWAGMRLPPLHALLRYGISPACSPTGRSWLLRGVRFLEIGPGVARIGSSWESTRHMEAAGLGDSAGRLGFALGLMSSIGLVMSDEIPVHWVEFPNGFALAETEVTNAQYREFNPEHRALMSAQGDRYPVTCVSWDDARRYCEWLSRESGLPVRLPTEAEWETACRAGSAAEYTFGDDAAKLKEFAWFDSNSGNHPQEVGSRRANDWGLHDLHGNVWEWCLDEWEGVPPMFQEHETRPARTIRGGSCFESGHRCQSASRRGETACRRGMSLGFRPAFSLAVSSAR